MSHPVSAKQSGTGFVFAYFFSQYLTHPLEKVANKGVTKSMHHTASGKMQYRTDGNSQILLTYFIPDPCINSI